MKQPKIIAGRADRTLALIVICGKRRRVDAMLAIRAGGNSTPIWLGRGSVRRLRDELTKALR